MPTPLSSLSVADPLRLVSASLLITLCASTAVTALAGDTAMDDWYPFQPTSTPDPGAIGLNDWLESPAGARGFVTIEGDRFAFEDGTPVSFWGINHGNKTCAPEHDDADFRAPFYRKYGVNCVRMHKFTWAGGNQGIGDPHDSTRLTDEGWDRFDYYVARLKEQGIYHGWSHIYGQRLQEADRDRVLAYDEIKALEGGHLAGSTIGLVNFAPDLQDISIQLTVNMLNHVNPYTGKRYADEPALAFIEFQNEDDIYFATTHDRVMKCPTYKRLFCELFSDWLREKYGSHEALAEAWGRGLNAYPEFMANEHLDRRNVFPIAHHWWYSREGFENQSRTKGAGQRLLDTAAFLHETQNAFYRRFAEAVRATGYKGPLVGSCWQAGDGIGHYYNLWSDARVGIIDRHNYFGGSGGHRLRPGPVDPAAMVDRPGSGLLGTGMQAVADRPFALSEWMSLIPNQWIAEATPIIAIYGMGLQGWDASYHFASSGRGFTETVSYRGGNIYNVDSPTQLGLYPALARIVHRGDVAEGDVVATRYVSRDDLRRGELPFDESVEQAGDVKAFGGAIPAEALAIGRVLVDFVERSRPPDVADLDAYRGDGLTHSTTGQLAWRHDGAHTGYFTVDTPATRAAVGFLPARPLRLGGLTLEPTDQFAVVLVTALGRDQTLDDADRLLVTVMARARNSGMHYSDDGTELLELGGPPILLEPVRATLRFDDADTPATVRLLDHDGLSTDRTRPLDDGRLVIDGRADRTPYYLIERDSAAASR